jgi:hypothetical protein
MYCLDSRLDEGLVFCVHWWFFELIWWIKLLKIIFFFLGWRGCIFLGEGGGGDINKGSYKNG